MSTKGFTNDDFTSPGKFTVAQQSASTSVSNFTTASSIVATLERSNAGVMTDVYMGGTQHADVYVSTTEYTVRRYNACTNLNLSRSTTSDTDFTTSTNVYTSPQNTFLNRAQSSTVADVTGDGTVYTAPTNTAVSTQRGITYSSPTTTADVTGVYLVSFIASLNEFAVAHNSAIIQLVASNRTYTLCDMNMYLIDPVSTELQNCNNILIDMDANDTFTITIQVSGGTKVIDYHAQGTTRRPCLSIIKVA